jgi:DnaJ-class molecular chaperone
LADKDREEIVCSQHLWIYDSGGSRIEAKEKVKQLPDMDVKEIKIDDLIQPCAHCKGTGKKRPDDPWTRVNYCDPCQGSGKQLTEAGKVLKQFCDELKNFSSA